MWLLAALLAGVLPGPVRAADSGASVVVVYNAKLPESKKVAEYYAQRRQVPAGQVLGFDLPVGESMTRSQFLDDLQKPLMKRLEASQVLAAAPASSAALPTTIPIRYAVLCYGVPTKILRDATLIEPEAEKLPAQFQRNEAAVDSQLACLPSFEQWRVWAGPLRNPFYLATNSAQLQPTNGLLMVTRLDGPSAAIARGLVDKAMEAETNGLWGRAYFDARGWTNGEYRLGDDWIRGAANVARRMGFETELDENPNTFAVGFPMSQIAFYAGWYDANVSGPFTRPTVEFMPGAFAYHLHSFSAQTLRSTNANWVGPLLQKGATVTMGCVDEPYLQGTPNVAAFLERFLVGFSFGEPAYASQPWLSWQTTVVGDPLYRPFARRGDVQHKELLARHSALLDWSYLRVVDLNQARGADPDELIAYLEPIPLTKTSPLLKEKLADLYWGKQHFSDAFDTYEEVLKLNPTPQQRVRVMLELAAKLSRYGSDRAAFEVYRRFLQQIPDYPERRAVSEKILVLARKLGLKEEVERYEREVNGAGAAAGVGK